MSVHLIARVWADPYFTQAQKTELLVALALADFGRKEDGKAWPSIESLSLKARTSVRCAQMACKSLEKAGKLRIISGGGQNGTNAYFLLYTPAPDAPSLPHGVHPSPRNGLPQELPIPLPKELAAGCTQTVRNHQEAPGTERTVNTLSPPSAGEESGGMSGFADFWEAYPRKREKGDAEKAWQAQKCSLMAQDVIAAVKAWKTASDWTKEGGQFIPYPGKWLRRRGWEDEPAVATREAATREAKTYPLTNPGPKGWDPTKDPMPPIARKPNIYR